MKVQPADVAHPAGHDLATSRAPAARSRRAARVAILPWGDVIEEFLDPIGLDLDDFAARMTGGWLFGYVSALQSSAREAVILCASRSLREPRTLVHAGTGARILAVPGRSVDDPLPWRRALRQWRLTPYQAIADALRGAGVGTVIAQDYEHARFDAVTILASAMRLPIFATFQGGDTTLSALEGRVRRWSLRRLRGVVVASARERERLAARYPRLRCPVADIPNPLDTREWRRSPRAEARAELGIPEGAFLVVSHGRIDIRRKGLDVLLEAWGRFTRDHPGARLTLIGSGQDREQLARLLAAAALPGITWHDDYLTDRARLRRWLSAADAYAIASRAEGMPVAPLEAMACELPVVASRAHGLPEIFRHGEESGGILVPTEDAGALATALGRLAASRDLRTRMGHVARAEVERRFSIEAVGAALDELLSSSGG